MHWKEEGIDGERRRGTDEEKMDGTGMELQISLE